MATNKLPQTIGEWFFAAVAGVLIVCWLFVLVGFVYVALHFIGKWW